MSPELWCPSWVCPPSLCITCADSYKPDDLCADSDVEVTEAEHTTKQTDDGVGCILNSIQIHMKDVSLRMSGFRCAYQTQLYEDSSLTIIPSVYGGLTRVAPDLY